MYSVRPVVITNYGVCETNSENGTVISGSTNLLDIFHREKLTESDNEKSALIDELSKDNKELKEKLSTIAVEFQKVNFMYI